MPDPERQIEAEFIPKRLRLEDAPGLHYAKKEEESDTPQLDTPQVGRRSRTPSETPQVGRRSKTLSETPQVGRQSRTPSETPQVRRQSPETPVTEPVSVYRAKPRFRKGVLDETPVPSKGVLKDKGVVKTRRWIKGSS